MSLTLVLIAIGGYLLAMMVALLFGMSLGRVAKDYDEREERHRRAEAQRRARRRRVAPAIARGHGTVVRLPASRSSAEEPQARDAVR